MAPLTWSWEHFFVLQNQPLPAGVGFGTFSAIHLGVLAGLAVGIAALVWTYRRAGSHDRRRLQLVVAWIVLLLEVLRQLVYVVTGLYSPDILPLHVCAIATVAVLLDAIGPRWVRRRWTPDFLYAFGWWGALAANVFPDWSSRPILNIFTWQSFAIHALITGYVLMRLVAGELVPDPRNLWRVALVVAVFATAGHLVNQAWGTNFWFLNTGAPDSPLAAIQAVAGDFYVPVLIVLLGIVWALLYLPSPHGEASTSSAIVPLPVQERPTDPWAHRSLSLSKGRSPQPTDATDPFNSAAVSSHSSRRTARAAGDQSVSGSGSRKASKTAVRP